MWPKGRLLVFLMCKNMNKTWCGKNELQPKRMPIYKPIPPLWLRAEGIVHSSFGWSWAARQHNELSIRKRWCTSFSLEDTEWCEIWVPHSFWCFRPAEIYISSEVHSLGEEILKRLDRCWYEKEQELTSRPIIFFPTSSVSVKGTCKGLSHHCSHRVHDCCSLTMN